MIVAIARMVERPPRFIVAINLVNIPLQPHLQYLLVYHHSSFVSMDIRIFFYIFLCHTFIACSLKYFMAFWEVAILKPTMQCVPKNGLLVWPKHLRELWSWLQKKEAGDGKQLQKKKCRMQMTVPVPGVGLIICCVASCYVDIVARGWDWLLWSGVLGRGDPSPNYRRISTEAVITAGSTRTKLSLWSPTGRHELRSFLAASSTQNYFLIARMLRFLWHSWQKCRI